MSSLFQRLLPGSRSLAGRDDAEELLQLYYKAAGDGDKFTATQGARLATLLQGLEASLGCGPADSVASFLLLGMDRSSQLGSRAPQCAQGAFRILARLVSFGGDGVSCSAEHVQAAILGPPAVTCGATFIKTLTNSLHIHMLEGATEFVQALADAVMPADDIPDSIDIFQLAALPPFHEDASWTALLLAAMAELQAIPRNLWACPRTQLPPNVAILGFAVVCKALEDQQGGPVNRSELALLSSAVQLYRLPTLLAQQQAMPGARPRDAMRDVDDPSVMDSYALALERLCRYCFNAQPAPDADSEESEEGDSGGERTREPPSAEDVALVRKHEGELLAVLETTLQGLKELLEAGIQTEVFMLESGGVGLLVRLVEQYYDVRWYEKPASFLGHPCAQLALECILALLAGPTREQAQESFVGAGGIPRLLDLVDSLPFSLIWDRFTESGSLTHWELQCCCIKALEAAVMGYGRGRAELVSEDGIESLTKAFLWDGVTGAGLLAPPEALRQWDLKGLSAVMPWLVACQALAVVAQVCNPQGADAWVCSGPSPSEHLARATSIEQLSKLVCVGDTSNSVKPGNLPAALVENKFQCSMLPESSLAICVHELVAHSEAAREEFMREPSPLLHFFLDIVEEQGPGSDGDDDDTLAQSMAFATFANLFRGRTAWRQRLLQAGVHLKAAAALSSAAATLKQQTKAARKAKLAKLHASRSRGARPAGCRCGQAGCPFPFQEEAEGAGAGGAEHEESSRQALGLSLATIRMLSALQQGGKDGRRAALDVMQQQESRLQETVTALAPLFNGKTADQELKAFLAWGKGVLGQQGPSKSAAQLQAQKAAEAAAAALLAEEEAAQRKAAAKAAKRQRQKAAKQQAKQAEQAEEEELAEQEGSSSARDGGGGGAGPGAVQGGAPHSHGAAGQQQSGGSRQAAAGAAALSTPGSDSMPVPAAGGSANGFGSSGASTSGAARQDGTPAVLAAAGEGSSSGSQAGQTGGGKKKKKKRQQQEQPAPAQQSLPNGAMEQAVGGRRGQPPPGYGPATPAAQQQGGPRAASSRVGPGPSAGPDILPALAAILDRSASNPPGAAAPPPPPQQQQQRPVVPVTEAGAGPSASSLGSPAPPDAVPNWQQEAEDLELQALLEKLLPGTGPQTELQPAAAAPSAPPSMASASTALPPTAPGGGRSSDAAAAANGHPKGSGASSGGTGRGALPPALAAVLTCRLSGQLLSDPVIAGDGMTYERAAFEAWLARGNKKSPATQRPLGSLALRPNFAVRDLLEALAG